MSLRLHKPWLILAAVLVLLLAAGALLVRQEWRADLARAQASGETEVALLVSLIGNDLQKGDYQRVAQVLQDWGRQQTDVVVLRLTAATGYVLSEYRRPGAAGGGLTFEESVRYSYRGEARLLLVKDTSAVETQIAHLVYELGGAYLVLGALLVLLTRLFLLHRSEAQLLRVQAAELDRANRELTTQIGQRREAELERDRLIAVVEFTPDFVGIANPQGQALYINRAGRIMTGLGDRPLAGISIADLHPGWAAAGILEVGIPAAIRDGSWSREGALRGADGREIPVSQVIVSHRDGQGRLEFLSTVMRDVSHRKRSEDALRQAHFMLEHAPQEIWLARLDGRLLYVNRAAAESLGYTQDELVRMSVADIDPVQGPGFARHAARIKAEGKTPPFETEHRARDGRRIPKEVHAIYLRLDEQDCICGFLIDLTERKRAEAALRGSETRLREAQRIARIGSWELDLVTNRLIWSDEIFRIFEIDPARFGASYEAFLEAVHPDDRDIVNRAYLESVRMRQPYEVVHRLRMQDGRVKHVREVGETHYEGGRALRSIGTVQDVTEVRRAEEAFRQFKTTLDLTHDCVFMFDPATLRFFYVNEGATEQVGYSAEELVTMTPVDIKPDFDERRFREMIAPLIAGARESISFETRHRHRDGHDIPVEILLQYVAPGGEPPRFVAIVRDITERRRADEALRRMNEALEERVAERTRELSIANRELEAFVYSVSHDLRTPLRGIDGFTQLLDERYGGALDEEGRGYLKRVRVGPQRMGRIIADLLALSRVMRAELKRKPVDLSYMACAVADELERSEPGRRVEWRIARGLKAHADHGLMRIVLENLLGNAWKYTGKTERAVIEFFATGSDAQGVEFCVRDNGAGFDMAHAGLLFQPFRRLHGQHEFEGTGVGLATVHRVIERHGGRVRGEGAVGQGAAFCFSLPEAGEAS